MNDVIEEVDSGKDSENASPGASTVHKQNNLNPHIGLEFDSLEDVKNFYKAFAKDEGFGIRTH
ncbi:hypothetical protein SESBI_29442 [Sesbania bispinosa]|nr:hypothetical protein SESBI_29442 [Sesbania bispinosa]